MRTPGEIGPGSHVLKPRQDTGLGAFNKEAGCETREGEGREGLRRKQHGPEGNDPAPAPLTAS